MKNVTVAVTAFIVFLVLCSCGRHEALAEKQKRIDDSIRNVVSTKYAVQSEIREALFRLNDLRQKLEAEKVKLKTENEQIVSLLAEPDGKHKDQHEHEITNLRAAIQSTKNNVAALNRKINQAQDKITAIKLESEKFR